MGWFNGRVVCQKCGQRVPKKGACLSPSDGNFGICPGCLAKWELNGRSCAHCHAPVHGKQELAFFTDRRDLGHFDCGGVRIDWAS